MGEGFVQGPDKDALKRLKLRADQDKLPNEAHGEVQYKENSFNDELLGDVPHIDAEVAETIARIEKDKLNKSMEKLRENDI